MIGGDEAADVFLLPTGAEGPPTLFLAAMTVGFTVLALGNTGNDVIDHERNRVLQEVSRTDRRTAMASEPRLG